jgi:hypothetical protein
LRFAREGERLRVERFIEGVILGQKVACFGSRETPDKVLCLMERLGKAMVSLGGQLASGHANGADLAFERGACAVKPESFLVCLPWRSYNKGTPINPRCGIEVLSDMDHRSRQNMLAIAKEHHPNWEKLSNGVRLLHGRNILIGRHASMGFCYLNRQKAGFGGSGQCYRFLNSRNVPVVDFSLSGQFTAWLHLINQMGF